MIPMLIGLPNLYDKFLISRFIAVAITLAIVFLLALLRKKRWLIPNTFAFYVFLLFLLLCGCSILWATNTAEAIFAFACQLLSPLVIIVFYSLLSWNRQRTQKALWIAAAVVLCVYLLFAVVQLVHVENFSYEQLYRVTGINGHKNLLAAMLFVLSAFLLTSFSSFESNIPKWISVTLFVIALTVIILLKSRAVLLSVMIASCFYGLLRFARHDAKRGHTHPIRYRLTLIFSVAFVFVFLTVGLRWFAGRSVPHTTGKSEIESKMTSTSSLVERCLLWEKTYQLVDKHPLAGCGIGNWQIHFPDAGLEGLYRVDIWNVNFTKPHNEYLGVLAETGYPGLLLYVVFLMALIVKAFFALRKTTNRKDFGYGALVLSIFVGSCVNALFDFPNSRIEHLVWMGILMALLLRIITNGQKSVGSGWNLVFLLVSAAMVTIGMFRYHGERHAFEMQGALKKDDWKAVEYHGRQALSVFYTVDPVGLPLHWYLGKAEKKLGDPDAINSFRQAYRHSPYCKENLNDLGLAEYYTAHDLNKAEFYLNEAIRISPNYLYPQLNLAYLYLNENNPQKAREVVDGIYFDEHKREVMKADAVYFEPFNTEAVRQKIDSDYEAFQLLRKATDEASLPFESAGHPVNILP